MCTRFWYSALCPILVCIRILSNIHVHLKYVIYCSPTLPSPVQNHLNHHHSLSSPFLSPFRSRDAPARSGEIRWCSGDLDVCFLGTILSPSWSLLVQPTTGAWEGTESVQIQRRTSHFRWPRPAVAAIEVGPRQQHQIRRRMGHLRWPGPAVAVLELGPPATRTNGGGARPHLSAS